MGYTTSVLLNPEHLLEVFVTNARSRSCTISLWPKGGAHGFYVSEVNPDGMSGYLLKFVLADSACVDNVLETVESYLE